MAQEPKYAEQYTDEERKKILIRYLIIFAGLFVLGVFWLQPLLTEFINTAHCQVYYGISGIVVIVYGLFVALPLLIAVILQLVMTPMALRVIRQRRWPPHETRVLQKTVVVEGRRAVVRGYVLLLVMPIFFISLISYGFIYTEDLLQTINFNALDYSVCVERVNLRQGL